MPIINNKTLLIYKYTCKEAIIILFNSILILIFLIGLNYFLYTKKYKSLKLFVIATIFLIAYFLIALIIYNNNIYNGYEYGILYGDVFDSHFCDEYRYYIDSNILLDHFKNGEFSQWLLRELPSYEFIDSHGHPGFGNYNLFVILLTLLKLIGINDTLELITLKLVVYIPTIIVLYKLSILYLNEKYSLLSVIIYSLLPGYILTNSLLMRDNLIVLLTLVCIYYILSKSFNLHVLIPILIVLTLLRPYMVAILIVTFIFCYKNTKKIISKLDIIYIFIILGSIVFFSSFNFNSEQMRILQERFDIFFGSSLMAPIRVCINTIIHVIYDPPYLSFLTSNIIYLIIFSLGNIIATIISLIFIFKYIYMIIFNKFKDYLYLLKFTFYFTAILGILVLSKDGYIINRIAIQWLPLFIIIILLPLSSIKRRTIDY